MKSKCLPKQAEHFCTVHYVCLMMVFVGNGQNSVSYRLRDPDPVHLIKVKGMMTKMKGSWYSIDSATSVLCAQRTLAPSSHILFTVKQGQSPT